MATVYRNRQLMHLSVILFFYFASIGCLFPYMTTHMRGLGFSLSEIAFINAVSAFISLIGPVLGGTFAERQNRYKSTTVFFVFSGALAFVALAFIPRYEKLNYQPLMDFDCDAGLRVERCVNWANCGEALDRSDDATKIKLSNCHYQCPKTGHFAAENPLLLCFRGDHGNMCTVFDQDSNNDSLTDFDSHNNSLTEFVSHVQSWPYVDVPASTNDTVSITNISNEEEVPRAHVPTCHFLPLAPLNFNRKEYHGISCRPKEEGCTIHCKVSFTRGGSLVLPQPCEEAYGNPSTTFWSYLILRGLGDLCLLTGICLLDALTIWSTVDYEGSYGRIHAWAALGIAALAPISGAALDFFKDMDGREDFSVPSLMSAAFALVTAALIIIFPIHRQKSADFHQSILPPKMKFLSGEMITFLIVILILGMQWSVLFTFMPWLTQDIGCSFTQMGLSFTLMFGFSLPFLLISKNMVRNIGKANLLVFAFLFYFTRYTGITFVSSARWTFPFALMGCFTLCVMWIAAVAYGQKITPPGYSLVMQYLLNMLHFGLGRGLGSLAGGALISTYSQRVVFLGIGVFSAVIAFFYLTVYHIGLRKKMSSYPATLNGSWFPLREQYPNGDVKARSPIVAEQEDDIDIAPNGRQANGK